MRSEVKRKITSFRVISRSPYGRVNDIFSPGVTRLYWTINVYLHPTPAFPSPRATPVSFSVACFLYIRPARSVARRHDKTFLNLGSRRRHGGTRYFGIISVDGSAGGIKCIYEALPALWISACCEVTSKDYDATRELARTKYAYPVGTQQ